MGGEEKKKFHTGEATSTVPMTIAQFSLVIGLAAYASHKADDLIGVSSCSSVHHFFHLLGTALLFGMQTWITFFGGLALFNALPRKHFGTAQKAQLPIYFRLGYTITILLLVSFIWTHPLATATREDLFQMASFIIQFLCLVYSDISVLPNAGQTHTKMLNFEGDAAFTKVGADIAEEVRNNPDYAKLRKSFRRIHGLSLILNMVSVLSLTYHLFYLSQKITSL